MFLDRFAWLFYGCSFYRWSWLSCDRCSLHRGCPWNWTTTVLRTSSWYGRNIRFTWQEIRKTTVQVNMYPVRCVSLNHRHPRLLWKRASQLSLKMTTIQELVWIYTDPVGGDSAIYYFIISFHVTSNHLKLLLPSGEGNLRETFSRYFSP